MQNRHLRSVTLAMAVISTFLLPAAWGASQPVIWFAPAQGRMNPRLHAYVGSSDYQDLYRPGADWRVAASKVQVMKVGVGYLRTVSDDDLRQVITFAKQHNIALALEIALLPDVPQCPHLEGHDRNQVQIAQRVQRLGGEFAYAAADEPLWFGHSIKTKPGCDLDLATLAQESAATAKALRIVFPKVQFVDIEPTSNFNDPNLAGLISQWHEAFKTAFGEPFEAFDFDVNWPRPWQANVRSLATQLQKDHTRIGVICNGDWNEPDDATWLADAMNHCDAFTRAIGRTPDDVIFQSWVTHPTHVLPESDPNSFTHLILDYTKHIAK